MGTKNGEEVCAVSNRCETNGTSEKCDLEGRKGGTGIDGHEKVGMVRGRGKKR